MMKFILEDGTGTVESGARARQVETGAGRMGENLGRGGSEVSRDLTGRRRGKTGAGRAAEGRAGRDFAEQVYAVVRQIPRGKVATYGQVARLLGRPGAARAVGNALHRNPGVYPVEACGESEGAVAAGNEVRVGEKAGRRGVVADNNGEARGDTVAEEVDEARGGGESGNAVAENSEERCGVARQNTEIDVAGLTPCHRVVNASGRVACNFGAEGEAGQVVRLRAEGVEVENLRVDLGRYGWEA